MKQCKYAKNVFILLCVSSEGELFSFEVPFEGFDDIVSDVIEDIEVVFAFSLFSIWDSVIVNIFNPVIEFLTKIACCDNGLVNMINLILREIVKEDFH